MDIVFEKVEHVYNARSPLARRALYNVNVSIPSGAYVAIVGHTGSGKSTLLQHLNGLLQPTSGTIKVGDEIITGDKRPKQLKPLRKKVGIVFQFPEHQLFEETVEKDICFGPLNFGVSEEEAKRKARELIKLVGLSEDVLAKSPFDLSGGQMRRVAIAGVLALEPEVLVLDEPTAGLDPRGRKEIMEMFYRLHCEKRLTTVLVTHSMEDAARYADQIIVMHEGTVWGQGAPEEVFRDADRLAAIGLSVPETVKLKRELEARFGVAIPSPCLTIEQTVEAIQQLFSRVSIHD
ncbi:energy-coupling factor ABC transporter ATP-binding protein [Geobacillus sp. WSUCF-018B]|uniref:energy-coupling factor ABC transporter ATP-binding protein n=1 Tax=Geobacillus sp. WSUCF-018B TaxID=2055939 RepID=UPI0005CD0E12|nr:energy-coupling factor ABC transporter ATP-binding protein [Geobacillus sp. WSUCF-018B]PJW17839.1 energy-coupling factor transporter ATPase [Geobacillus sp. WSUCF-018B]QOR84457.1 energy-coupling factor ABC transporter ATP-binding protein [Geobacillus stearothermophilus]WJQ10788.1 energy-coupling factor ABC transporter ATP-binding protein [Geobacillus stearothermophilus]